MARILWTSQQCSCRFRALPIALELQRRGHKVSVLTTPAAEESFVDLGFRFFPERHVPPYDWSVRDLRPFPLEEEGEWSDLFRSWFIDRIPDQVADVLSVLAEDPHDLVLTDFLLFGPGFAAEAANVPWACYIPCHVAEPATNPTWWGSWWNDARQQVGLPSDAQRIADLGWLTLSPFLNLQLVLPELCDGRIALPGQVHRVGPSDWDPPAPSELPPWVEQLGSTRPAVLVSTSSAWQQDAELLTSSIEALADEPVDVVMTVPAQHGLPPLPANMRAVGHFPHGLLFSRVHVVVCSGGTGITSRAASNGVPVVAVPRNARDVLPSTALVQAGAGVVLDAATLSAPAIRAAVRRALADDRLRENARRLQVAAKKYSARSRSADLIEALL